MNHDRGKGEGHVHHVCMKCGKGFPSCRCPIIGNYEDFNWGWGRGARAG